MLVRTDFGLNSRTPLTPCGFEIAFAMLSFGFLMSNIKRMTVYTLSSYHSYTDSVWHKEMTQKMLALVTSSKCFTELNSFILHYAFVTTSIIFVLFWTMNYWCHQPWFISVYCLSAWHIILLIINRNEILVEQSNDPICYSSLFKEKLPPQVFCY